MGKDFFSFVVYCDEDEAGDVFCWGSCGGVDCLRVLDCCLCGEWKVKGGVWRRVKREERGKVPSRILAAVEEERVCAAMFKLLPSIFPSNHS
jgi:hypothetical protein